jgi:hypothetical protein
MTPLPLGILALAGVTGGAPAYDLLESEILSTSASTITFSSLGNYSDYKDFQIRLVSKDGRASQTTSRLYIRFNGVSSDYFWQVLGGSYSAAGSGTGFTTNRIVFDATTGANAGDSFGASVIDILDPHSSTKYTTIRALGGMIAGGYEPVFLLSGLWQNTAALTSITIGSDFSSFVAGSRFSLYGSKGA